MKWTLRALGWAKRVFWVFLILFIFTCVYSAVNVKLWFGEPNYSNSGETIIVSIPLFINNGGYYGISDINLTSLLRDDSGVSLAQSTTTIVAVQSGQNVINVHNVSINMVELAAEHQDYLFNDTEFTLQQILELKFAGVIPFYASTNMVVPWGAPLSNFTINQIFYDPLSNSLQIHFSFDNNSPYFDVDGTLQMEVYNNRGGLVGLGETVVQAASFSSFTGLTEISVGAGEISGDGEILLYFRTSMFTIGPLVIQYG